MSRRPLLAKGTASKSCLAFLAGLALEFPASNSSILTKRCLCCVLAADVAQLDHLEGDLQFSILEHSVLLTACEPVCFKSVLVLNTELHGSQLIWHPVQDVRVQLLCPVKTHEVSVMSLITCCFQDVSERLLIHLFKPTPNHLLDVSSACPQQSGLFQVRRSNRDANGENPPGHTSLPRAVPM